MGLRSSGFCDDYGNECIVDSKILKNGPNSPLGIFIDKDFKGRFPAPVILRPRRPLSNNASTCHETSEVIRINGIYGNCNGSVLAEVNNSKSLNLNSCG